MTTSNASAKKRSNGNWKLILTTILLAILFGALGVGIPLLFSDNLEASAVLGILITYITTAIGVITSWQFSKQSHDKTLKSYGLQAWRNINSLESKVRNAISRDSVTTDNLEDWMYDINVAKWGWRDLISEELAEQKRFEREAFEIYEKYEQELNLATTPEERDKIERDRNDALEEKTAKAPLPVRMSFPVKTNCPKCDKRVHANLGSEAGDTSWITCDRCNTRFAIHRNGDGSFKIGEAFKRAYSGYSKFYCPSCKHVNDIESWKDNSIEQCSYCATHMLYTVHNNIVNVSDLGVTNNSIDCPQCTHTQDIWVNPTRAEVKFKTPCDNCQHLIQITGKNGNAVVEPSFTHKKEAVKINSVPLGIHEVHCPTCTTAHTIDSGHPDASIRCSGCSTTFRITETGQIQIIDLQRG